MVSECHPRLSSLNIKKGSFLLLGKPRELLEPRTAEAEDLGTCNSVLIGHGKHAVARREETILLIGWNPAFHFRIGYFGRYCCIHKPSYELFNVMFPWRRYFSDA